MTGKGTDIQSGSGEALAEAAQADARENALKVEIARRINRILIERSLAQARAARMLGLRQLHVSDLQRYRLSGFSVEHLMTLLGRLARSHGKIGV